MGNMWQVAALVCFNIDLMYSQMFLDSIACIEWPQQQPHHSLCPHPPPRLFNDSIGLAFRYICPASLQSMAGRGCFCCCCYWPVTDAADVESGHPATTAAATGMMTPTASCSMVALGYRA